MDAEDLLCSRSAGDEGADTSHVRRGTEVVVPLFAATRKKEDPVVCQMREHDSDRLLSVTEAHLIEDAHLELNRDLRAREVRRCWPSRPFEFAELKSLAEVAKHAVEQPAMNSFRL